MDLRRIGWLNLLLVFIPIALGLKFAGVAGTWIFVASAVAIIPLAGLMGRSTEMIAHRLGPGIGGLMNASFGNAAELIIAVFALRSGHVEIVKASLTGSILGNILLVLGASFLVGGLRFRRQVFNRTAAGIAATLLALAAVGLLVPALFHAHLEIHHERADEQGVSLEIAIVLFAVYVLMLLFSLRTHKHLYSPEPAAGSPGAHHGSTSEPVDLETLGDAAADATSPGHSHPGHGEDMWPQWVSITVLVVATVFVAIMSELLVGTIEEAREVFGWTELFVGVIVIAIVGNAAEHSSAILVAYKNQMDLSFQIAVGSGLQIALFVAPLLVFISYLPGFPQLDLIFSMLEVVAVLASVLIVGLVAHDGESNWLEGLMLLAVYLILGIAFLHLPESHAPEATGDACTEREETMIAREERVRKTIELLSSTGWDEDDARQAATEAADEGEPLLEHLCFQVLAEHVLATIHDPSWIANRGSNPDSDGHGIIKRLLDSGASAEDLAIFARMMQREYLGNLGCILDGAGIYGTPRLPFEDYRIFAVDDDDAPLAMLDELHESLGFPDLETEMKLSLKAERDFDAAVARGRS